MHRRLKVGCFVLKPENYLSHTQGIMTARAPVKSRQNAALPTTDVSSPRDGGKNIYCSSLAPFLPVLGTFAIIGLLLPAFTLRRIGIGYSENLVSIALNHFLG